MKTKLDTTFGFNVEENPDPKTGAPWMGAKIHVEFCRLFLIPLPKRGSNAWKYGLLRSNRYYTLSTNTKANL